MQYHYVYKIINLNPTDERKYYIGVRTSTVKPEEDISYLGSSRHLREHISEIGECKFLKEILSVWDTRIEANEEEIRLHKILNVASNFEFYNKTNASSSGYCAFGCVTALDLRDNTSKQISREEFRKNDYYVHWTKDTVQAIDIRTGKSKRVTRKEFKEDKFLKHPTKGTVVVRDKKSNTTKSVSLKEFGENDDYVTCSTGQVSVIDTRDNSTKRVTREEFKKYEYYVRPNKGLVAVKDVRDGSNKLVSKEDYKQNEYFVMHSKGKITVKDIRHDKIKQVTVEEFKTCDYYIRTNARKIGVYRVDGSLLGISYGDFVKFCTVHRLTYKKFVESFKNAGCPVFQNASENTIMQLKRNSREFQIGWYAKILD